MTTITMLSRNLLIVKRALTPLSLLRFDDTFSGFVLTQYQHVTDWQTDGIAI